MDAIITPLLRGVVERALRYLQSGLPVHFSGPAGTGKTTLALHVAGLLGSPVTVLRGDEELTTSGLVGGIAGVRHRRYVDNFIRTVVKMENEVVDLWQDERLTEACREGHVLVYDEFTRSRPEANNIFLTVLEEGVLPLSRRARRDAIPVHPGFRVIFTSNPEEYAGVYKAQDALRDRMVTIHLGHPDEETEVAIAVARGGVRPADARRLVSLVRRVREAGGAAGLRATIFLARVVAGAGLRPDPGDAAFRAACLDILGQTGREPVERALSRLWSEEPAGRADETPV